jgi:hypothetical protein
MKKIIILSALMVLTAALPARAFLCDDKEVAIDLTYSSGKWSVSKIEKVGWALNSTMWPDANGGDPQIDMTLIDHYFIQFAPQCTGTDAHVTFDIVLKVDPAANGSNGAQNAVAAAAMFIEDPTGQANPKTNVAVKTTDAARDKKLIVTVPAHQFGSLISDLLIWDPNTVSNPLDPKTQSQVLGLEISFCIPYGPHNPRCVGGVD